MRRAASKRIAGGALAAALAPLACGSALAYFSTTGVGEVGAAVTKLSAPAISSATPGVGGTVALSWGAVSAPGTGTVTYYVTRDGGTPTGTCPGSSSPAAVTSCTDSGVEPGTHVYTVTAKWRSWSATSSPSSAKVTIGPATHFSLTAASTTPTAGVADNLTATALDVNNSTVTTYTGSHSLTFSGAAASPGGTAPTVVDSTGTAVAFGTATAITFTSGVATVSSAKNGVMKLYRAGASSISVTDGTLTSTPALAVTVSPAAVAKLALTAETTTPTAGAADDLTIAAQDTYANTATSYSGAHELTFTGASASPSGAVPTVSSSAGVAVAFGTATRIEFSAGIATAVGSANGEMRLYKSGATNVKVSDGTVSNSPTLAITVAAAAAVKLVLSAASTTPTAGAADNLTTTAQDTYNNTATSYSGAHNLTFSGASTSAGGTAPTVADSAGTAISFGAPTSLTFTAGVASVASAKNGVMKLYRAEAAGLSVSDGTLSSTPALAVTVSAAAASKLAFANLTISTGSIGSPCFFTCTVTALGNAGTIKGTVLVTDTYGNTVSALGTGHSVAVTVTPGGTVTGGSLTIASSGLAESTSQFLFTAQSGTYTDTVKAATSAGTVYSNATITATK